jgi:type II secretory pathway predicted ATPase ExeA
LTYAITQEGIIKVTGEVGSGKTMLSGGRRACRKSVETVYLANPAFPRRIMHAIAFEAPVADRACLALMIVMHALNEYRRRHAEGRQVVIFVENHRAWH